MPDLKSQFSAMYVAVKYHTLFCHVMAVTPGSQQGSQYLAALFDLKTSILHQKHHPYVTNVNSIMPGDSNFTYLHCEDVLGIILVPSVCCRYVATSADNLRYSSKAAEGSDELREACREALRFAQRYNAWLEEAAGLLAVVQAWQQLVAVAVNKR